jgi:hypothetical protein
LSGLSPGPFSGIEGGATDEGLCGKGLALGAEGAEGAEGTEGTEGVERGRNSSGETSRAKNSSPGFVSFKVCRKKTARRNTRI